MSEPQAQDDYDSEIIDELLEQAISAHEEENGSMDESETRCFVEGFYRAIDMAASAVQSTFYIEQTYSIH